MVRVVLIDDDPLVRAGLKLMLGGHEGVDFVGEGSDGSEAAALVAEHQPDVLLMDIRMPGKDGLTATEELMAQKDAPRVVILTTFDSDDSVLRALAAGPWAFCSRTPRRTECWKPSNRSRQENTPSRPAWCPRSSRPRPGTGVTPGGRTREPTWPP